MKPKSRRILIALAIVATLVVAEVVLERARGPEAMILVENAGVEPIENLTFVLGSNRAGLGPLAPGLSGRAFLSGSGPQTLVVSFSQRGNPMTSYQLPGFDPDQLYRDGFKLVLKIRSGEVERYQDDAEPTTPLSQALSSGWAWVRKSLGMEPDVLP